VTTDTNLIQFLAAAGILAAALTFISERIVGRFQRRRELRGLMRILRAEIAGNQEKTEAFSEDHTVISNEFFPGWERYVWQENAPRIAQLISKSDFERLTNHYQTLGALQTVRDLTIAALKEEAVRVREDLVTRLAGRLPDLRTSGDDAMGVVDKHL
jgi:hypothetical protein